jgi:hypothetical protein
MGCGYSLVKNSQTCVFPESLKGMKPVLKIFFKEESGGKYTTSQSQEILQEITFGRYNAKLYVIGVKENCDNIGIQLPNCPVVTMLKFGEFVNFAHTGRIEHFASLGFLYKKDPDLIFDPPSVHTLKKSNPPINKRVLINPPLPYLTDDCSRQSYELVDLNSHETTQLVDNKY